MFKLYKKDFTASAQFTLIEIVMVLSVIMILSGIVLANLKTPVFASLDKTAKSVQAILSDANRKSFLQGKQVIVVFDNEKREFKLMPPKYAELDSQCNTTVSEDDILPDSIYRIPSGIDIQFPEITDKNKKIEYEFFPNGEAYGPEMKLSMKDRSVTVGVSFLTGMTYAREEGE